MKKLVWIIIVVSLVGFFVNTLRENKANRQAKEEAATKQEQSIKSTVRSLAVRYGASDDWDKQLSKGDSYRMSPVLTIELEKVWLQNQPILFVGTIKDIASHDENNYLVTIERNPFSFKIYTISTELRLSLLSKKGMIDDFLKKHPSFTEDNSYDDVAIIANINAIRTNELPDEDGYTMEIKIGDGEMIDILYTGGVDF